MVALSDRYKKLPNIHSVRNNNATIWRHMDFTKFVNLISRKEAFFSRTDKLGDPFEGSCPDKTVLVRDKKLGSKYAGEFFELLREFTVVNCWHLSKDESAAMWKLYLKSDEGIAINSSFKRLRDSLDFSNLKEGMYNVYIGKVQYIDYRKEEIPIALWAPFFHKRKSFKHESELRIVIQKKKSISERSKRPCVDGLYIPVDLDRLVKRICLAPKTPEWLFELVTSVTQKYNLSKKVVKSNLDITPMY